MIHNRNDARLWQQFRADIFKSYGPHAFPGLTDAAPPTQPTLSVVLPPTPPVKDWRNGRLWFVPLGLALGAVAALALHWPRPALRFALYAAAGCAAAFGASLLTRPMYTSTAVLRISPAHIPESLPGVSGPSGADCVRQARQELLTDEGLTGVFVKRGFPFTVADVPKLRQRIQISPISHGEFQITVVDSNRFRAKQMADQMVVYFMERNVLALRAADKARANGLLEVIHEHMAGESLEVLDPASLPEVPSSPDRLWFVAIGAAIGLILAVVAGGRPTTPSLIPTRNAASDAPSTPSSPKNISGPFTRIDRLIRMGY